MKVVVKILIFSFFLAIPLLSSAQSKELQRYFKPSIRSLDTLNIKGIRSTQTYLASILLRNGRKNISKKWD